MRIKISLIAALAAAAGLSACASGPPVDWRASDRLQQSIADANTPTPAECAGYREQRSLLTSYASTSNERWVQSQVNWIDSQLRLCPPVGQPAAAAR
jgi:hypothetical protein